MIIIVVPKIRLFKISERMIDLDSGLYLCVSLLKFAFSSVNCGTPPVPSNGITIPCTTGTTEGAQAIILCRDIFHSSLLRDNYTVSMCTMTGQWEPDPNDYCAILSLTGIMYFLMYHATLNFQPLYIIKLSEKASDAQSQTVVIAVAVTSSCAVLILIFFGLGIICGCLCRQCKNEKSDSNNNSTVVYEEVEQRQNLELNQNVAYDPVRVATTELTVIQK